MKPTILLTALCCALIPAAQATTIDLETPSLGVATHDEDWNPGGGFSSGGAFFNNTYDGSWAYFALSRETDASTGGFGNQYSAITGSGYAGSLQYAVSYVASYLPELPTISLPAGERPLSVRITNTTYAALSMRDGDSFAKKFGGASGNDADWFKLTIRAYNAADVLTGTSEFYLADYRFADNSLDYIVTDWREIDLSSFAASTAKLTFNLDSSDIDPEHPEYGINTPAYFALDQLTTTVPEPASSGLLLLGALIFGARRRRAVIGD